VESILFVALLNRRESELSMETGVEKARKSNFCLHGSEVPASTDILFHFSVNIIQDYS